MLVYADTVFMVLVRNSPQNATYIAAHRLNPEQISPQDYVDGKSDPDLLALQQIRIASLLWDLGQAEMGRELIRKAEPAGEHYGPVRDALEEFRRNYPLAS